MMDTKPSKIGGLINGCKNASRYVGQIVWEGGQMVDFLCHDWDILVGILALEFIFRKWEGRNLFQEIPYYKTIIWALSLRKFGCAKSDEFSEKSKMGGGGVNTIVKKNIPWTLKWLFCVNFRFKKPCFMFLNLQHQILLAIMIFPRALEMCFLRKRMKKTEQIRQYKPRTSTRGAKKR